MKKQEFYNELIKGYQKIINRYVKMMIFGNMLWFWIGYVYGMNNWIIVALLLQIFITIMYIIGEKIKLK